MLTRHGLAMLFAWLVVGSLAMTDGVSVAGEGARGVSRADLVTAVEWGAGPSKGAPDAPLVMVEFSDFQCGYCRVFWREALPKTEERYIRPGKLRFVYRHMAIQGEGSILAAQAASCAHDQGKFWEYHDRLFSTTGPLAFTASRLKRQATELALDERSFAACVDGKRHAQQIEAETMLGHVLGANGTPAFLINGKLAIGAYPFEAFRQELDSLLAGPRRQPASRTP